MRHLPAQLWVREAENHNHQEPFFIFGNEIWEDHLQSVSWPGREGATLYVKSDFPQKKKTLMRPFVGTCCQPFIPAPPESPITSPVMHTGARLSFFVNPIPTLFPAGAPFLTPSAMGWVSLRFLSSPPETHMISEGLCNTHTHGSPLVALFLSHTTLTDAPDIPYFLFASLLGLEKL